MQIWHDQITGTQYYCNEEWLNDVRIDLATGLMGQLAESMAIQAAADKAALFWHDSYKRIFPLRFGRKPFRDNLCTEYIFPNSTAEDITLEPSKYGFRQHFLDVDALPPILPDPIKGKAGWLLADRILTEAALINLLSAQHPTVSEQDRQAARLAALTYLLRNNLKEVPPLNGRVAEISRQMAQHKDEQNLLERVRKTVSYLSGGQAVDISQKIGLVAVAAQRIKQYVFDTTGLNEIRGGSSILDDLTDELRKEIGREIGPEVVLRAAGATLLFLAPNDAELAVRPAALRTRFFEKTRAAFPAASQVTINASDLVNDFKRSLAAIYDAVNIDRAQAHLPNQMTYPFESRCHLCHSRAAFKWSEVADDVDQPICEVCNIKRKTGREERRGKVYDLLVDLGIIDKDIPDTEENVDILGVKRGSVKEWTPDQLDMLVHDHAKHRLLGVVYGDGDNFGAVSLNLPSVALSLQWTARVEQTTRAATALSLAKATQWAAGRMGWKPGDAGIFEKIPFQILAIGGDDISLFASAPIATYFAAEFTYLTDIEFKASVPLKELESVRGGELHFSLGVLASDINAPVAKTVDFTESKLLKWAKKVSKAKGPDRGRIALLYAERADAIPADLGQYQAESYTLGLGDRMQFHTSIRPYTAPQLQALLQVAGSILKRRDTGRLNRLANAFYGARQGPFAGMLFYAYQKGRLSRAEQKSWIEIVEEELNQAMSERGFRPEKTLLVDFELAEHVKESKPGGRQMTRISPMWDLVELTKIMS